MVVLSIKSFIFWQLFIYFFYLNIIKRKQSYSDSHSTLNSRRINLNLPALSTRRRQQLFSAAVLLLFLSLPPPLSAANNRVQQNEESDPISRFRNYLRINTAHPKPNYTAAVDYLTAFAATIPTLRTKTLYLTTADKPLLVTWPGSNPSLPAILLNSHLNSVPAEPSKWLHPPPFAAVLTADGRIYARGAQDDKCIAMQYLEAIRELQKSNLDVTPIRTVHISYVPEEEIGGFDGMMKFVETREFQELNVGFVLDEGQASVCDEYRVFYADRSPWHVVFRRSARPAMARECSFDNNAMENLMKSVEMMMKFKESGFELVKSGLAANSEVISVNPVFLNAGIRSNDRFMMNLRPSEAEAEFHIRLPPTADPDLMRRIAEEWAPAWRNMSYEITEKGPLRDYKGRPLMTATDDSNLWWSVFNRASGKLARPEILSLTTDARFMRQLGIPTLGFSPMKNTPILLHDHNEFLEDSVYLEGIKVYEHVIRFLSSFDGMKQDE